MIILGVRDYSAKFRNDKFFFRNILKMIGIFFSQRMKFFIQSQINSARYTLYTHDHQTSHVTAAELPAQNFLKVSKSTSINLPSLDEPFISLDGHVHVPIDVLYRRNDSRSFVETSNKRPPIKLRGTPHPYIP